MTRWQHQIGAVFVAAAAILSAGCATPGGVAQKGSATSVVHLPGFQRVDAQCYRGGQPSAEGMAQLARLGVNTVISLRQPGARGLKEERRLAEQLGMRWVNLPMWYWWRPSHRQVEQFAKIVNDPASYPLYIHCRQGANRTGTMVALYRILRNGWEAQQAYEEALSHGLVRWNVASRAILFRERHASP